MACTINGARAGHCWRLGNDCRALPAGSIADRVGSRRVLVFGLLVFAAASAMAMLTSSPLALTAFRALSGAGAAFVIPTTLVVTINAFPPKERGKAIGVWAAAAGVGAAAGVLIAGALQEFWSWRREMDLWEIACDSELQEQFRERDPTSFERLRTTLEGIDCSAKPSWPGDDAVRSPDQD